MKKETKPVNGATKFVLDPESKGQLRTRHYDVFIYSEENDGWMDPIAFANLIKGGHIKKGIPANMNFEEYTEINLPLGKVE